MGMTEELTENKSATCYRHTEIEAVGACLACGKPLCETCGEWFNGRFYCVPCYATVEIMHAQADSPQLQNLQWHQNPANILALLFASYCLILPGFYLLYMHKIIYGIVLLILGWIIQGICVPLIRNTPALTREVKRFFTVFLYISLVVVVLITVLFLLFKVIKF
jgi:hypothetical protein